MPRKPIDYSKGVIYKIVCKDLNIKKKYYGSTTDLRNRKYTHKTSCNNVKSKDYNMPIYQFIRVNGGWDNWDMILIKEYSCKSKLELEREERRCMEEDHNRLNKILPTRTKKEYYIDNADKIKEQATQYRIDNADKRKQYRINNADKIKEQQRQYYIDNADKLKQYSIDNADKKREREKQRYINNADKIKEKQKQYYINNQDKIKQRRNALITCECGCVIRKASYSIHLKSQKHKKLLNQNQEK